MQQLFHLQIWNVKERKMARSILAHDGPIWAMVRHGKILVSVSQDKTVSTNGIYNNP